MREPGKLATYKLEQEGVLPQSANAAGESQDEHHPPHHQEQPHRVEAPQVCDGRDVGQDPLRRSTDEQASSLDAVTKPTHRLYTLMPCEDHGSQSRDPTTKLCLCTPCDVFESRKISYDALEMRNTS